MLRLVIVACSALMAASVMANSILEYREPTAAAVQAQQAQVQADSGRADTYYNSKAFKDGLAKEQQKLQTVQPLPANKLELPDDLKNQRWAEAFNQVEQAAGEMPKEAPGAVYGPLVFASLSVGRDNLKILASDAHKGQGAVVFRGVKNDSFKEMRAALTGLGDGYVIDPTLFLRFNITEVPTIVLPLDPVTPCEPDGCPPIAFVKVAGSVTVEAAMEYIRINSSQARAKQLASDILKRIRE